MRSTGLFSLGWAFALSAPISIASAWVIGLFLPFLASAAYADVRPEPVLSFVDGADRKVEIGLEQMRTACVEREVEVDDPYHAKRMRYLALPLACVLDLGFPDSGGGEGQRGRGLLLRALDGYTRPVSGAELLEAGGFLAFGESALVDTTSGTSRFSPIDRRRVDPAPFYLIWTGPGQNDPHVRAWPYQLARIEVAPFEEAFPRTVPRGLPKANAGWGGYALFQKSCASCHAINGEGGRVGPDLNVPLSIVEYRPISQIRAYVRNPEATRYTSMPAHPQLTEDDLDALIAYFSAMRDRKDDPRSRGGS